jgi:hypothetical protein
MSLSVKDLDAWIEKLYRCEFLSEDQVNFVSLNSYFIKESYNGNRLKHFAKKQKKFLLPSPTYKLFAARSRYVAMYMANFKILSSYLELVVIVLILTIYLWVLTY